MVGKIWEDKWEFENFTYLVGDPLIAYGLGIGVALSLLFHLLGLIDIPYKKISPVPGVISLPLIFPQPLTKIPPPPQQVIKPPLQLHICQLPLPPYLLCIPLCVWFSYIGVFDARVDIGPKFGPCILQLFSRPPPEGPIILFPHPLHLLSRPP